ncbi:FecR family protein [Pedobacter sp. N36a]|uniref:FecR family protein n=1 Tax=Pedobacter sp. N36a TaxID=2767996 RepID=UPI0016569C3F|nr:FecR family protein [Pedobacter sp. N36a]MBC8986624.1 FecR family protein [Pedobacter sp. N36a]
MQSTQFKELLRRYLANQCSSAERAFVENWYNQHTIENSAPLTAAEYEEDIAFIHDHLERSERVQRKWTLWPRIAVAAVVLFTLGVSIYYYFPGKQSSTYTHESILDIKAGTDKAMLTLADGSKISLSDVKAGEIAMQSGLKISKSIDGQLVYSSVPAGNTVEIRKSPQFNTIETPRGGKFQILLPDGSKVWLDAASSLKYPVEFVGAERKVELTGQAYFEVAKKHGKSFKVISGKQELEVLGTHFNINAYANQPNIVTTLLEGSVRLTVKDANTSALLKPGQQSALEVKDFQIKQVDVEDAIAWKTGFFAFDRDDVPTVLHKLERWYDVDISIEGEFDQIKIGGTISRSKSLSEVLRVLQLTRKIKFKTEGRRIIAMP